MLILKWGIPTVGASGVQLLLCIVLQLMSQTLQSTDILQIGGDLFVSFYHN